jgi:hypothetical protein
MKAFTALIIALLVGSTFGWLLGSSKAAAVGRERTEEAVRRREEVDTALAADYAALAIPMIERGDTNAAVQRLSRLIAVYYDGYASKPGTNEMRLRGKRAIEEMARTNQILTEMIQKVSKGE